METSLWSRADLDDMIDALAQTLEVLPLSMEIYRLSYLRALRDMAKMLGIARPEPRPRRPLPGAILEVYRT